MHVSLKLRSKIAVFARRVQERKDIDVCTLGEIDQFPIGKTRTGKPFRASNKDMPHATWTNGAFD